MLLVYHILIWSSSDTQIQLALSFILYGMFLLWQPLWEKDVRIAGLPVAIFFALFFLTVTFYAPNESLLFFGLLLTGLFGSRLLTQSGVRAYDLVALIIVTLEMAVGLIPDAFVQINLPNQFSDYMQTVILIPILLLFFTPNPDQSKPPRSQVDLMHGLLTSTLIFLVVLGGIVINLLYHVNYLDGLLLTVFIVSTLTIGISWFWNPGIGFSGIGVLLNRYTMTIGGPFETWISTLTALIEERYLTPREFLRASCEHLVENDWLMGIEWSFESNKIISGEKSAFRYEHKLSNSVQAVLYYKSIPGSALEQHTSLLVRMAYQFYLAKLNQEKVRAQEHFATIHHTGARLTHDIKNILQSIKTSLAILNNSPGSEVPQNLLQSNLTQISNRLETTLNKLKAPDFDTKFILVPGHDWMDQLEPQYQTNPLIVFSRDIEIDRSIPADLFDSVIDNLINNALKKTTVNRIDVRLHSSRGIILLSVCDDGEAIPQNIESELFSKPLSSGSGMGVGLYQSSIMAQAFSFELELSQNEPGKVCFNLFQHLEE